MKPYIIDRHHVNKRCNLIKCDADTNETESMYKQCLMISGAHLFLVFLLQNIIKYVTLEKFLVISPGSSHLGNPVSSPIFSCLLYSLQVPAPCPPPSGRKVLYLYETISVHVYKLKQGVPISIICNDKTY